MTEKVLVGYATRYGSTQEVAEVIAAVLRAAGLVVDLQPLRGVRTLEEYGAAVLGAALYRYRWNKDALKFLSRHQKTLMKIPVAAFVLGPVRDPRDEQEWQDSRTQLDKELEKYPWFEPVALEMLGGKFDPEKLGFPLNKLAASEPATDIRDWEAIRAWANGLPSKLFEQP